MKRFSLVLAVFCVIFVAGCSNNNTPSAVVREFYNAVAENDVKKMGQYATPETVGTVSLYGQKMQGYVIALGKITNITEEIDGDTAVVTVSFANDDEQKVDVVKIDGKWKVKMEK
jgi:uncharacterized lipoprotein